MDAHMTIAKAKGRYGLRSPMRAVQRKAQRLKRGDRKDVENPVIRRKSFSYVTSVIGDLIGSKI